MAGRLENKKALVTGGSRGIGGAIATAFAAEGADVAFCHNDDPEGAAASEELIGIERAIRRVERT
jgi:3-oxoacyl-[acyl-carrier protein] reductase